MRIGAGYFTAGWRAPGSVTQRGQQGQCAQPRALCLPARQGRGRVPFSMEAESGALPQARPSRSRAALVLLIQLVCVALVAHALWDNRHELTDLPHIAVGPFVLLFVLNLLGHLQ